MLFCMAIKQWYGDEMHIEQDASIANTQTHVEKRLAAMRATVARERKRSDGHVIQDIRDSLQVFFLTRQGRE